MKQDYMFNILEIMPKDIVAEVLDNFTEATDVKTMVVDHRGKPFIWAGEPDHIHLIFCNFCNSFRSFPEFRTECEKCDGIAGLNAFHEGQPLIYKCHMGMVEVASPITVNGQYLGSLMIGQVRIEKEEYDTIEQLCHSKVDLNSYPILKDLYESSKRDLPFVPLKKLKAFSKLLHNIANYIAEISASNIIQRRVDQLNFEILEKENTNNLLAKNLVQLELRNIQMQINPQFLFKTLNTINNLVILEQPQQASEIISTLSELLRRNTRRVEGLVTLRDEWNNVQNYLSIRELIRADDVKVETSIDESCLDALVPPFLIQPLVEKALVHGLGPKVNEGALSVGISRSDNMVKITVADDGVGMGKKELDYFGDLKKSLKVDSSVGGFANILAILRHYFEDEFDWNVRSSHGKGTSFEFLVPYRPNEEGSV